MDFDQQKIWGFFQNNAPTIFSKAEPRYRALLHKIPRPARILNVGIGAGSLEEIALHQGHEVYCLDPDPSAIAKIAARLQLSSRAKVGVLESMPFDDNFFDAVIVSEVLEHLGDGALKRGIQEIGRVLRPTGQLIGSVPADEVLADSIVACPYCSHSFHRWGHLQSFDERTLSQLLESAFCKIQISRAFFPHWKSLTLIGKIKDGIKLAATKLGCKLYDQRLVFCASPRK